MPVPATAQLVTLQEAKDHLQLTTPAGDPGDADLILKLAAAENVVLDFCGNTPEGQLIATTWTAVTVPMRVHAAILLQCADLYRFRGDDARSDQPDRAEDAFTLSQAVRDLLRPWHDPVLA